MLLIGESRVGVSAKATCAITVSGLAILRENALMWASVTTVLFRGTMLRSALCSPYVGIVENQGTWPAIVLMRESVIHVEKPAIVQESARILRQQLEET